MGTVYMERQVSCRSVHPIPAGRLPLRSVAHIYRIYVAGSILAHESTPDNCELGCKRSALQSGVFVKTRLGVSRFAVLDPVFLDAASPGADGGVPAAVGVQNRQGVGRTRL